MSARPTPDPLAKYAIAPEWLDDARQAMQALYGAAAGHPKADVIERNVARINEALKRAPTPDAVLAERIAALTSEDAREFDRVGSGNEYAAGLVAWKEVLLARLWRKA